MASILNRWEIKVLFKNTILFFGKENQKIKAIEELSELIKALSKNIIHPQAGISNINEEIADCYIMLKQLEIIYNNKKNVNIQTQKNWIELETIIGATE